MEQVEFRVYIFNEMYLLLNQLHLLMVLHNFGQMQISVFNQEVYLFNYKIKFNIFVLEGKEKKRFFFNLFFLFRQKVFRIDYIVQSYLSNINVNNLIPPSNSAFDQLYGKYVNVRFFQKENF